jgi:aspartyl-tRNA(Asn)/glutamyl-tRNA(Gln) amidotransferase subunit A
VPTTVGSSFFRDRVASADAVVVQRLRAAGAVIIGKAGLNEFAYGVTCDNEHFGAVRNPWDPARIPGGSSGGSGAAVGADLCMAALGSDAGGSVRVPAAICGVSGLRPTIGTVSAEGTYPIAWTIETVGPMARSVDDVARLLAVIADIPACDGRTPVAELAAGEPVDVEGLRVGLPTQFFFDVDPEVAAAVRAVGEELRGLGAEVADVELGDARDAVAAGKVMIRADAYAIHEERLREHADGYSKDVRTRLQLGAEVTGAELARANQVAREWAARVEAIWRTVDVLLTPTVGEGAPLIEGSDMITQTESITRLTLPFSLCAIPALSVPCGFTSGGLPIGAQLVAARHRDDQVLRAGRAYQQVSDWHRRRPSLEPANP